jgi:hypothetical protein
MNRNTELQSWKEAIRGFLEWYEGILERTQKVRKLGYYAFADDASFSIKALRLRLQDLMNRPTPNLKGCKKIKILLEESMRHRIKQFELEVQHFKYIQGGNLPVRLGAVAAALPAKKADELLKRSIAEFHKVFKE